MNWINVNERLPEHGNNVLAVLYGKVCVMCCDTIIESGETYRAWCYVYDGLDGDGIFDDNYEPTHWMELPTAPN